MNGELSLRLETDEVEVTTFFKGLQNHHFQVSGRKDTADLRLKSLII